MIPRIVERRIRPMWIAALASAAWVNRNDVKRWTEFLRRAVQQRQATAAVGTGSPRQRSASP